MALLADAIRFGEPSGGFSVYLVDVIEAEGVKMISRRKSFDPAEARMFEATG
ncbi:MAG: hypothetical protein QOG12_923 [Verrucomicrobiota bacterium]